MIRGKVRRFPLPGEIEQIGHCIGTPMPINPAFPRPAWRELLGGGETRATQRHPTIAAA